MNRFYIIIFLVLNFSSAFAADIFVNVSASGSNNGTSWVNAYTELQDALDNAAGGDNIYIAEGTYTPQYTLSSTTPSSTDRNNAFHIANKDVTISGGWDASTGTQTGNNTVLSGDIGTASVSSDNAYHVFVSVGQTNSAVFEKLVFVDGSALTICAGSPTFGGVTVYNCSGSAVNMNNSSPVFNNCAFIANTVSEYGALVADGSAAPKFNNCLFKDNVSVNDAALHANTSGSLEFINCSFIDNTTTSNSSAIGEISTGDVLLVNCLFFGNSGGSDHNFRGTLNASSSNNAADAASSTLSSSTNYLNLSAQTSATLFVNSAADADGTDNTWMTSDDELMPLNSSVLKHAGTSTNAPTTDITGATRYSTPTIGAYKSQVLSSTTLYEGNGNSDGKNSVTAPNNSMTFSNFTVPAGDDRLLMVASIDNHSNTVSASFNGIGMTFVKTVGNLDVFSLTLGSGVAITGDVVVYGSFFFCTIGAQSFNNINQTTPIDNITTDAGYLASAGSISKTVTSATSDLVCDFISAYYGTSSFSISADASQTETFNENSGHHNNQQTYFTLASSIKEGASTVDMDWNIPSAKGYYYVGLNLNIADPTALPVDFSAFNATWQTEGETALLNWQTSMEENNSHFEVQRSYDGAIWKQVGTVQGQGSTFETTNYQFIDELAANSHQLTAQVYYRLKQVDYDGQFDYSGTRTLNLNQEMPSSFNLWPNPSQGEVVNVSELDDYTVFKANGREVASFTKTKRLPIGSLEPGAYIIRNTKGNSVLFIKH
ncbi:MAG: hypothetical protein JXQ87_04345 [Bacteroidia bacterium]